MSKLVPIFAHKSKQPPDRYYYDARLTSRSSEWKDRAEAFFAYATKPDDDETTPIYEFRAENPERYHYNENSAWHNAAVPGRNEWSPTGVAFYVPFYYQLGVVPVYEYSARNPERYYYDLRSTNTSGWGNPTVAFHAYAAPPGFLRTGWMGHVQALGDKPLTEITIPGTHDTGTWKIEAEVASKCQDSDLGEQLNRGIRFIDIRLWPEVNSNTKQQDLAIWHGSTPGYIYFSEVLTTCMKFLQEHRTECIIMSIKMEGGKASDYPAFRNALNPFLTGNSALFYTGNTVPKLSEVRGKIVLFRRYVDPANTGIDAVTGWPNDRQTTRATGGRAPMMIQDVYRMSTFSEGPTKFAKVESFLNQARKAQDSTWWLNFTSTSGGATPRHFAYNINPLLQQWLEDVLANKKQLPENQLPQRLGTLPMDFPSPRIIDLLILMNLSGSDPRHDLRPLQSYRVKLSNNTGYIGHSKLYDRWNYAQMTKKAGEAVGHTLVKVGGNPVFANWIYPGDTVMLLSTQFTNDLYVYLEGRGDKSGEGYNLFYDQETDCWWKDPKDVQWVIERNGQTPFDKGPIRPGENVRFRSLSFRGKGYLCAQTDGYLATRPTNDYDPAKTWDGGFDWTFEYV